MSGTKKILTGIGAITIVLLLSVWIYLFIYGTPDNVREITTDLGFDNEPTEFTPVETGPTEATLALSNKIIAQLTTRAVAGFGVGDNEIIRYAERGTGHIYEIDLSTGTERRVSGTTIGQTVEVYFNDTLDKAVIVSEVGDTTKAGLYALTEGGAEKLQEIPGRSWGFSFNSKDDLNYVSASNSGNTAGYQYNIETDQTSTLWSTPLADINVFWNDKDAIIASRPAPRLKSGVYVAPGQSRLITPQYNLSVKPTDDGRKILYAFFNPTENQVESYILDRDTGETTATALPGIPEKCTYLTDSGFWCASSLQLEVGRESLTAWYRGEFVSSDSLWKQNSDGSVEDVTQLSEQTGFDIDVTDLRSSSDGNRLFFRNKINDTLWMYRISEPPPNLEDLTTEEANDASVEQTPAQ